MALIMTSLNSVPFLKVMCKENGFWGFVSYLRAGMELLILLSELNSLFILRKLNFKKEMIELPAYARFKMKIALKLPFMLPEDLKGKSYSCFGHFSVVCSHTSVVFQCFAE